MEKQKITIDFMTDADNEAILSLSHRCPQDGMIGGYPDRSPEFRRIHQQVSKKSYHKVARKGDTLIGAFGAIYSNLQYKDVNYDSAYLMDLKVDPAYRRSTVAYRVVKETVANLGTLGTELAIASFLKDNDFSLIFTKSRAGIPDAKYLGDFMIFSIVPILKKKVSKKFIIDHPTEKDIPELVKLYNKFYSRYKLAPRMSEELFRYYITEIDGMGLSQFRVARQDGKIKAVLCAWDEDRYKKWFV
ncbi:MAG: GNAT family N-acetyltransferase, partial [Bacteroidales bacterium]|nr:GNAT family N-acetyltransferase [Bacteroidales bacterium]